MTWVLPQCTDALAVTVLYCLTSPSSVSDLKGSLVEYRGSHSAWDVVREGEELFTAHERYAAAARRAADRLRALGLTPVFAE